MLQLFIAFALVCALPAPTRQVVVDGPVIVAAHVHSAAAPIDGGAGVLVTWSPALDAPTFVPAAAPAWKAPRPTSRLWLTQLRLLC